MRYGVKFGRREKNDRASKKKRMRCAFSVYKEDQDVQLETCNPSGEDIPSELHTFVEIAWTVTVITPIDKGPPAPPKDRASGPPLPARPQLRFPGFIDHAQSANLG
jgi:hypothetical protein